MAAVKAQPWDTVARPPRARLTPLSSRERRRLQLSTELAFYRVNRELYCVDEDCGRPTTLLVIEEHTAYPLCLDCAQWI